MYHEQNSWNANHEPPTGTLGRFAALRVVIWGMVLGILNGLHWLADVTTWGWNSQFDQVFRWIGLGIGGAVAALLAIKYIRAHIRRFYAGLQIGLVYVIVWEAISYVMAFLALNVPKIFAPLLEIMLGLPSPVQGNEYNDVLLQSMIVESMVYSIRSTPVYFAVGLLGIYVVVIVHDLLT